jgi:hypothetical protein
MRQAVHCQASTLFQQGAASRNCVPVKREE